MLYSRRSIIPDVNYVLILILFVGLPASRLTAEMAPLGEIDADKVPAQHTERLGDPSTKDGSALIIDIKGRATLLLKDTKGRRAGYDPRTKGSLKEIPNSDCTLDFIKNRYTDEERSEVYERVIIEPAPASTYTMDIQGLQDGPFEINVSGLSREGSSLPTRHLEGVIDEGKTKHFRVNYNPSPNAPLSLVEEHR